MTQPEFFFPVVSRLASGDSIFVKEELGLDIPEDSSVKVIDAVSIGDYSYLVVEYMGAGIGTLVPSDTTVELVPPF